MNTIREKCHGKEKMFLSDLEEGTLFQFEDDDKESWWIVVSEPDDIPRTGPKQCYVVELRTGLLNTLGEWPAQKAPVVRLARNSSLTISG